MKWMMVEIVTGYNDAGATTSTINYINPKYIVRIRGNAKTCRFEFEMSDGSHLTDIEHYRECEFPNDNDTSNEMSNFGQAHKRHKSKKSPIGDGWCMG